MNIFGTNKTTLRYKFYVTATTLCGAGTVLASSYAHPVVAAVGAGVTIAAAFGAVRDLVADQERYIADGVIDSTVKILSEIEDAYRPGPVNSPRGEQSAQHG